MTLTPGVILRRVRVLISVYYSLMVEYRGEIFFWAIATSLPLIMMGVWVQAGRSGQFVFNDVQMARYFIAVFVIRQLTVVWVVHDFEYQVISGRLSPLLLQPMDPGWRFILMHVGEQLSRLPIVLGMVLMCFVLYPAALWGHGEEADFWLPPWWRILLFVVAVYSAFVLRYVMQYTFAMGAFWFERVAATHQLLYLMYLFFSGMVYPLVELRDNFNGLYQALMLTPFPYMVWFPASLLIESDPPIFRSFAVIVMWFVILALLNRWLWRMGLKHYSAMGA